MNDVAKKSRNQLRAALIGTKHAPKRQQVKLFGQDIELQQPTLKSILQARDTDDEMTRTADVFISYAYVPGTDERIFEEADRDAILNWPFTEELLEVQRVIGELTGVDLSSAEEVIQNDPLPESS